MQPVPSYIHRLLSSCQTSMPDAPQEPEHLAEIWPLNGNRLWAETCLAWLDDFLRSKPTPSEFEGVFWQGWHDSGFISKAEDYQIFFDALRNRLVREIPRWRRRHIKFPGLPKEPTP